MNEKIEEFSVPRTGLPNLAFQGTKLGEVTKVFKGGSRPPMVAFTPYQGEREFVGFQSGHTLALYKTAAGKFVAAVAWSGDTGGAFAWAGADVQDDTRRALDFLKSHEPLDTPWGYQLLKRLFLSNPRPSDFQQNKDTAVVARSIADWRDAYSKLVADLERALTCERVA